MNKNPVLELMVAFEWGNWKIRLWIDKGPHVLTAESDDVIENCRKALRNEFTGNISEVDIIEPRVVAEFLAEVTNCAAVEVLREDRCGVVFYPDWR